MKIIAQTSANGEAFLVQATGDELALCCGYYYTCNMPPDKRPKIGMEINITTAYATTRELIEADRELSAANQKVSKLVTTIEILQTVLAPKIANIKAKMP